MEVAFRVVLYTKDNPRIMRLASGHTWRPGDRFTVAGREWQVDAVLVRYADKVPYPAQAECILIAGDRLNKRSIIISAEKCTLVESE